MEDETKRVIITDIKMPFFSMVIFIIKWMLASIPAFIIIGLLFTAIGMGLQMSGLSGLLPSLPNVSNMSTDSGSSETPSPVTPAPDESAPE